MELCLKNSPMIKIQVFHVNVHLWGIILVLFQLSHYFTNFLTFLTQFYCVTQVPSHTL